MPIHNEIKPRGRNAASVPPIPDAIYVDTTGAATRYGLTRYWFEKARCAGDGPPFSKAGGCVLYNIARTDAWFEQQQRSSTSDIRAT